MRIEQHFPTLNELMVHKDRNNLPQSAIIGMMRMNPQLRKIGWREVQYDVGLIRAINDNLPLLEELTLWSPQCRFSSFTNETITFENVTKFTLNA